MTTSTSFKQKQSDRQTQADCYHTWKNYKQTIRITNPNYDHSKHPYFIVRGCLKCKMKHVIDYRVE